MRYEKMQIINKSLLGLFELFNYDVNCKSCLTNYVKPNANKSGYIFCCYILIRQELCIFIMMEYFFFFPVKDFLREKTNFLEFFMIFFLIKGETRMKL